jgi:protoporphyrinogen oxidase
VLAAIFEPLSQLKFELPAEEVSGAWLGARLHFREGSAPLGYIPGANWTAVLCEGLGRLLQERGVKVRLGVTVERLETRVDRVTEAVLADGERVGGDVFVSSIPTEVYCRLVPQDLTPHLASIRYTAVISAICATHQVVEPDFYWMVLASLDRSAGGLFMLNSLNPTIGESGDACLNFVNHIQSRDRPSFRRSDDEIWDGYSRDFREIFGVALDPFWTHLSRIPMYSPIFYRGYQNPPVKSTSMTNLYFAGNYRTFPSIVSTGTALASGLEAGEAILRDGGRATDLRRLARTFRLSTMPRAQRQS